MKQYFHGVKHTKRLKRMSFLNQTPQNYVHTFEEDLFLKHINKFNMIMRESIKKFNMIMRESKRY